jgi:hypothetical protein
MNDSKKTVIFMLMSAALLATFVIFVAALKGDSTLRIVLAAGGFLGFAGLYAALLVASKRTPSA